MHEQIRRAEHQTPAPYYVVPFLQHHYDLREQVDGKRVTLFVRDISTSLDRANRSQAEHLIRVHKIYQDVQVYVPPIPAETYGAAKILAEFTRLCLENHPDYVGPRSTEIGPHRYEASAHSSACIICAEPSFCHSEHE